MKATSHLSCSPDEVAIIKAGSESYELVKGEEALHPDDMKRWMTSFEMETNAAPIVGDKLSLAGAQIISCHVGDGLGRSYLLSEHLTQVVQQFLVLGSAFTIYDVSKETGLFSKMIEKFPKQIKTGCVSSLKAVSDEVFLRAHVGTDQISPFVQREFRELVQS